MENRNQRIKELNDGLRTTFIGGTVMITAAVEALDLDVRKRLLAAIRLYDSFSTANDPNGEHDFGSVEIDAQTYFFKIDYYDRAMRAHSPDEADPKVTTRVLTIMRADEY